MELRWTEEGRDCAACFKSEARGAPVRRTPADPRQCAEYPVARWGWRAAGACSGAGDGDRGVLFRPHKREAMPAGYPRGAGPEDVDGVRKHPRLGESLLRLADPFKSGLD